MKHIRKFNEDLDNTEKTLRDLIGDIKEEKKVGDYTITETTGGCFVNFDLNEYLLIRT